MGNRRKAASFLITAVHENSGSASPPDRFTPRNKSPVPTEYDAWWALESIWTIWGRKLLPLRELVYGLCLSGFTRLEGRERERERGGGLTNYSLHRSHYLTDVEAEACTGFWWGNLRERDRLGDPGVDGRIILRWFFGKRDVRVYTGSSWLRIGTGGGHL
jgi:hypothetical protein